MAEDQRRLITCRACGGEFLGWPSRKLCPDCAAGRQQDNSPELDDEKDGWRNMLRDSTGTVIVPGGNVMTCLDDLCAYEEACEAAGIRGPEELAEALKELNRLRSGGAHCAPLQDAEGRCGHRPLRTERTDDSYDPHALRPRWTQGKHCEGCGHYHPTIASGARGICDKHPRRVRPEGGKRGKYVVLDEPRQCQARRVACGDWTRRIETPAQPSASAALTPSALGCQLQEQSSGNGKEIHNSPPDCCAQGEGAGRAPEWVGPCAEMLREATKQEGDHGKRTT